MSSKQIYVNLNKEKKAIENDKSKRRVMENTENIGTATDNDSVNWGSPVVGNADMPLKAISDNYNREKSGIESLRKKGLITSKNKG